MKRVRVRWSMFYRAFVKDALCGEAFTGYQLFPDGDGRCGILCPDGSWQYRDSVRDAQAWVVDRVSEGVKHG